MSRVIRERFCVEQIRDVITHNGGTMVKPLNQNLSGSVKDQDLSGESIIRRFLPKVGFNRTDRLKSGM